MKNSGQGEPVYTEGIKPKLVSNVKKNKNMIDFSMWCWNSVGETWIQIWS